MARILTIDAAAPRAVDGPWQLALTDAGAWERPADFGRAPGWIAASVPGTVAGAMRQAGLWHDAEPAPIHARDVWYRAPLAGEGRERLVFEGLATLAEVWIDGILVLTTRSMFVAHSVDATLTPASRIAICFRSLAAQLARPHRRGRWRPRLATPGSLRNVRTSLLGFMPGWCPPVDCVGPYRPVTREPLSDRDGSPVTADLRATLDGTTGRLAARIRIEAAPGGAARLRCAGREVALGESSPGLFEGVLEIAVY